jgi:transcriptional regulator with XRE-family HTH domain
MITFTQELNVTKRAANMFRMDESSDLIEFSKRLNDLCDVAGLPPKYQGRQQALAKIFDVSQKGARRWLEAEAFPTWDKLIRIAKMWNITIDWLMTGREPKHPGGTYLTPEIAQVVETMMAMEPEKRQTAKQLVDVIAHPAAKPNDTTALRTGTHS